MALHFEFPDAETKEKLFSAFPGYHDGFVRCQPGNLLMPLFYKKDWKTYYDFQLRDDDVFHSFFSQVRYEKKFFEIKINNNK